MRLVEKTVLHSIRVSRARSAGPALAESVASVRQRAAQPPAETGNHPPAVSAIETEYSEARVRPRSRPRRLHITEK